MRFTGDFRIKALRNAENRAISLDPAIRQLQRLYVAFFSVLVVTRYARYMPKLTGTYHRGILKLALALRNAYTAKGMLGDEYREQLDEVIQGLANFANSAAPTYGGYQRPFRDARFYPISEEMGYYEAPAPFYIDILTHKELPAREPSGRYDFRDSVKQFGSHVEPTYWVAPVERKGGRYHSYTQLSFGIDSEIIASYEALNPRTFQALEAAIEEAHKSKAGRAILVALGTLAANALGLQLEKPGRLGASYALGGSKMTAEGTTPNWLGFGSPEDRVSGGSWDDLIDISAVEDDFTPF